MVLLRCFQTCTAAAALFALSGACGLPAPGRTTRVVVRPRPSSPEVRIRSLTGAWVAVWRRPEADEVFTLSMVQSGDAVTGTLVVRGRTLASDPSRPARLDANGQFVLGFGQTHETIDLHGRPDSTGDRVAASISGLAAHPLVLTFRRQ